MRRFDCLMLTGLALVLEGLELMLENLLQQRVWMFV
jgi:hypothetical protein